VIDGGESDDVEGDIVACTAVAITSGQVVVVVAWWWLGPKGGASGFDTGRRLQGALI
jgi:hypothetical protein